jgi:acyl-CoA synthetase (AMP-forming)/AMP-acid ligase II
MTSPPESFTLPAIPYYQLLRDAARRFPDKVAVIFQQQRWTYARLEGLSNRFARALFDMGLGKGDRVILATYNRPEFIVSFNAIAKVGGVVSPMNPSYKAPEVEHQVNDTEATIAIADATAWRTIQRIRERLPTLKYLICVDDVVGSEYTYADLLQPYPETPLPEVALDIAEDLLALIYSSGTTSRPKGVMLTHRNLLCSHLQYTVAGRVTSDDVSLIFLPFCHVYGLMLCGGAIAAGATQVVMERYNLEQVLQLTQAHRVTLLYANPPVLVEMADYPHLESVDFGSVKYINSGGAPLPDEIFERMKQRTNVFIARGYGMTEASLSGNFVPGEERKIVDAETGERELGVGEPGEIIIRGPHIMKGYWKDAAQTARVIRNGWLYTGDIGVIDARDRIRIVDRKKEMIKYKGFAVSPTEIESVLFEHPAVADCAVTSQPDLSASELPIAYVVLKGGAAVAAQELIDFVAARVAGYKRLHQVSIVSTIPRNDHGKIVKSAFSPAGGVA